MPTTNRSNWRQKNPLCLVSWGKFFCNFSQFEKHYCHVSTWIPKCKFSCSVVQKKQNLGYSFIILQNSINITWVWVYLLQNRPLCKIWIKKVIKIKFYDSFLNFDKIILVICFTNQCLFREWSYLFCSFDQAQLHIHNLSKFLIPTADIKHPSLCARLSSYLSLLLCCTWHWHASIKSIKIMKFLGIYMFDFTIFIYLYFFYISQSDYL